MKARILAIVLVLITATQVLAEGWQGVVVAATDGDTIKVLRDKAEVKIRLYGVDAPEKKQAFGQAAKEWTIDQAVGRTVQVDERGSDRYGRVIAVIILPDGKVLNRELLRAGLAWWYKDYAKKETAYQELEAEARAARRGLWADPAPVAPWEYRRVKR
jgi:endonuclease YncB( thermonuclease family)